MSTERKEILQMLKDGVITVDDAEKLIKALNEGEVREKENTENNTKGKNFFDVVRDSVSKIVPVISDGLSEIGPAIQNALEDINTDSDPQGCETVATENNGFIVPAGSELILKTRKKLESTKKCGNLNINGCTGNRLEFRGNEVEVLKKGTSFIVKWNGSSDFSADVPATVTSVRAGILGGNIDADKISCPLVLKTLGGNISVNSTSSDLTAKTMGGNVQIFLSENWQGNLNAHTMGGNMLLSASTDLAAELNAATMGGSISIDPDFNVDLSKKGFPFQSVNTRIGNNGSSAVRLKTMGGDIEIIASFAKKGNI